MLEELGWRLEPQECMRLFLGKALKDEAELIERHTGFRVSEAWLAGFRARRDAALRAEVRPIDGALEVVAGLHTSFGAAVAVASGADRAKVEMQLQLCGLSAYFDGRVFSGHEVPRSKPAPDVYLAAAAGLGVAPSRCVVVEDSGSGILAGKAAGTAVVAVPNEHLMPPQDALDKADAVLESLESFPLAMRKLSG